MNYKIEAMVDFICPKCGKENHVVLHHPNSPSHPFPCFNSPRCLNAYIAIKTEGAWRVSHWIEFPSKEKMLAAMPEWGDHEPIKR